MIGGKWGESGQAAFMSLRLNRTMGIPLRLESRFTMSTGQGGALGAVSVLREPLTSRASCRAVRREKRDTVARSSRTVLPSARIRTAFGMLHN